MKNFVVNMGIAGIACLMYYLNILELFTSKYAGWIIGGVIFLLFLAALKILGNPFAKDDDDD